MTNIHMNKSAQTREDRYAELLDTRFEVPGTEIRFGWDFLVGLIPGLGDWLGAVLAVYIPFMAVRYGASFMVIIRMFLNILFDLLLGIFPLLGDLLDLSWRANLRNARLLKEIREKPEMAEAESRFLVWGLLVVLTVGVLGVVGLIAWLVNILVSSL